MAKATALPFYQWWNGLLLAHSEWESLQVEDRYKQCFIDTCTSNRFKNINHKKIIAFVSDRWSSSHEKRPPDCWNIVNLCKYLHQ